MSHFRRRRYIISAFQANLLLTIAVYGIGFILILATAIFIPLILDQENANLNNAQRADASALFLSLDLRLWPAVLLGLATISAHAVLLTHKIAGPLYRIRETMRIAAQGDYSIVARIRQKDLLHDEADALNTLLERIESMRTGLQEELDHLRKTLHEQHGRSDQSDPAGLRSKVLISIERLEAQLKGKAPGVPTSRGLESGTEPSAALPSSSPNAHPSEARDDRL